MKLLINWNFLTVAGPSDRVGELIVSDVHTHFLDYFARVLFLSPCFYMCFFFLIGEVGLLYVI